MSGVHASDADLQLYVSDRSSCGDGLIRHIKDCAVCRSAAENYRLIFSELPAVPAPAFDFDVAASVMAKLPEVGEAGVAKREIAVAEGEAPVRRHFPLVWIMIFVAVVPLYLFRKNLQVLFTDVTLPILAVMTGATLLILLFMLYTMTRQYRRRLEELAG